MVELALYWLHEHGNRPVTVSTPAALDDALDQLRQLSTSGRVLAQAALPRTAYLDIGVYGDKGVLHYTGPDCEDGAYSKGSSTDTDSPEILYYYMGSDTPFPPNAEIPVADVRLAALDFMATGQRPRAVQWQPRPQRTAPDESDWSI